jgi:hypothetical protein
VVAATRGSHKPNLRASPLLTPFSKLQGQDLALQNVWFERLSAKNFSNPRFSLMRFIWLRLEKKTLSFQIDLTISNALGEKS